MSSVHSFTIKSIEGKPINLADFKGKKMLIVNTASECGYTPQYAQLQELYQLHQDKLVILGCPCNDFGGQEPDNESNIQQFCSVRYGVTFPLSEKVHIKSAPQTPLYQWLTDKTLNGVLDAEVRWNFHKFLLDEQGNLLASLGSGISPLDDAILEHL